MPWTWLVKSPRSVAPGNQKYVMWVNKWLLDGTLPPKGPVTMAASSASNKKGKR
jgi:hypothetical protein